MLGSDPGPNFLDAGRHVVGLFVVVFFCGLNLFSAGFCTTIIYGAEDVRSGGEQLEPFKKEIIS